MEVFEWRTECGNNTQLMLWLEKFAEMYYWMQQWIYFINLVVLIFGLFGMSVFEIGKEVDILSATVMESLWKRAIALSVSQK
jgi:hypothetical protein